MTIPLHYRFLGSGAPVIILHGLFGNHRNWLTIGKKISQFCSVYLPDARNHGSSPHYDQMDYFDFSDDLLSLIQKNKLKDVTLIGHSMGGKTAMLFALNYPDLVKQLIVIDIAPVIYDNDLTPLIEKMQELDPSKLKTREEAVAYFKKTLEDDRFNQYLTSNLKLEDGNYKWRINLPVIANNISIIRSFPEIGEDKIYINPTMFIKGDQSDYILDQYQSVILEKFPSAIFRRIQKCGHNPHIEQPEALWRILQSILKS